MKTASIPSVRVEPELREQVEGLLRKDETLSSFVETAIRDSLRKRQIDAEFHARGLASLAKVQAGEPTVSSEEVLAKLEARLAAAKTELAKRRAAKAKAAA